MPDKEKKAATQKKEERIRREKREDVTRWILCAGATGTMILYILLLLLNRWPSYPEIKWWY